ncbi:nibrin homolog isoform X2 [Alnus glutinosa]|uniref:nibrin homolog isoform X2 n=1 Tax=Alnus glutinosa TaxID=3517 RepID=UPI002D78B670|nr:nibrin homolog isoform X2 [Alnus glutinosa]
MVWGLFPADPLLDEDKYYIFARGTYKVGRKGCDVIITKNKGVSRIHAEIVVDAMTSLNPLHKKPSNILSKVRIRDCSKYGTFIDKNLGQKEKVNELPNKETMLEDGDLISFGTGNAIYRFSFVPLIFFVCSESFHENQPLQDKISSIGAHITDSLTQECTHVLVDQLRLVKEDIVDAIVSKKPIVLDSWIEFVAEKSIHTEIPSCSSFAPMLTMEGVSVKVADPKSREKCLEGYTFLLEPIQMFKDRLQSLLEVGGAKIVSIKAFYSSSQDSGYGDNSRMVYVVPGGSAQESDQFQKLSSLWRVNEMDLVRAVLSGWLDPSILISPCVLVSSSCSTDETVVADSDVEVETATSIHANATVCTDVAVKFLSKAETSMTTVHTEEDIKFVNKTETSMDHVAIRSEDSGVMNYRDISYGMTVRRDEVDESECGNADVIYSQNLVVRDVDTTSGVSTATNNRVPNFKLFRKANTPSGNSFNNLIPFSKYPYKDSDFGSEEMVESVKAEKKRKQMEAVAEDLFNNEKAAWCGRFSSWASYKCLASFAFIQRYNKLLKVMLL